MLMPCIFASRQNHTAAAWAVARGDRQRFERPNLSIPPILAPENIRDHPSTSFAPCTALTLSLAHVALRSRMAPALATDATKISIFRRRSAGSKAAVPSTQLRRWMKLKSPTHLGVLGRLGALERSICACASQGVVVSVLARVVLVTILVSVNGS